MLYFTFIGISNQIQNLLSYLCFLDEFEIELNFLPLYSSRSQSVQALAAVALYPVASPLSICLSSVSSWKVKEKVEDMQGTVGSLSPAWGARRVILATEKEEELVGTPTDLWVKLSVNYVIPPAIAPLATAPPVTVRPVTAIQVMREGVTSVATPASPQLTATGSLGAPCSHPRMKMKRRRTVPSSLNGMQYTVQKAGEQAGLEEREGLEG